MNLTFAIGTLICLIIGVIFAVRNTEDRERTKQNILMYSVIPSIIFGIFGHLVFGAKVRHAMKWGDGPGTLTLQREIGLISIALLAVAVTKKDVNIGLIWGVFLVLAGINHFIETKKVGEVIIVADIVFGLFLVLMFGSA